MITKLRGIGLIGALTFASAGAWLACGDDTNNGTATDGGTDSTGSSSGTASSSGSSSGKSSSSSGSSGSSSGKSSSSSGSSSGSSSSSSSSSGSSSGASEGGIDGATPTNCTDYCTLMSQACTGANMQYSNNEECMTACQYFSTADADTGNTFGCHAEHAHNVVALSAPNPHCWHAGPYGWGICGTQCDDFCNLATSYCVADAGFDGAPPYANLSACTTACSGFTMIGGDSGTAIVLGDGGSFNANGPGSGNTLDCREYHLGAALSGGAASMLQNLHCPHPAVDSGVCF